MGNKEGGTTLSSVLGVGRADLLQHHHGLRMSPLTVVQVDQRLSRKYLNILKPNDVVSYSWNFFLKVELSGLF